MGGNGPSRWRWGEAEGPEGGDLRAAGGLYRHLHQRPCAQLHPHESEVRCQGVDEIICVSVNDPFVMKAWGDSTGATAAGITMLGDGDASFTKAIGMDFDVPAIGFHSRSKRYALLAEYGLVKVLNLEKAPGACEISAGETLLAQI